MAESLTEADQVAGQPGNPFIATHALTKRYSAHLVAVDSLNLTVRQGEVYGFLGPNGAGKTTTLRMLLGLIRPTSGTASVLGASPGTPAVLQGVGALVESPTFYPYLSGQDNLRVLARYASVLPSRVAAVLAQVGLAERAGDKFGRYSLGMKQRLGVAAALLKDPLLLILDEPTNGLDPEGIVEMRSLIRALRREGRTVLLSSHLLGEVEQVCDRVGVIRRGQLVAEGTVAEIRGQDTLLVRASPLDRARRVAEQLPGIRAVRTIDGVLELVTDPARAGAINRALVEAEVDISELRPMQHSLEEVFLDLMERRAESTS